MPGQAHGRAQRSGLLVDTVDHYNELVVHRGGLCRIRDMDVMPVALDLINKTKKFGAYVAKGPREGYKAPLLATEGFKAPSHFLF